MTLSNIFTMRLIGNKTHGDLAEIGIAEFINQFMYDFKSRHVGKDMYRAKEHEEDIVITNELSKVEFPVSLKAYGDGPLQLSTDKNSKMFPFLENEVGDRTDDPIRINTLFENPAFFEFGAINVMPLIYNEGQKMCNIMVFDYEKARNNTASIQRMSEGNRRKHPIYLFLDRNQNYICEVRYGSATANALQRGLWTNSKRANSYFDSLTNGWMDYSENPALVKLFALALVSSDKGHQVANEVLQRDIDRLKTL